MIDLIRDGYSHVHECTSELPQTQFPACHSAPFFRPMAHPHIHKLAISTHIFNPDSSSDDPKGPRQGKRNPFRTSSVGKKIMSDPNPKKHHVSITPLLKRLSTRTASEEVSADEVAAALALIFTDSISPVQFALLLWALHVHEGDRHPKVLTACAKVMREAASQVDGAALGQVVRRKAKAEGKYGGGFCDIVGTGGDGHNTFNVSTTSSILASAVLMMAKHGNNSSTSLSGSADLLAHASPRAPVLTSTTPAHLARIYERTNYAFLYAREWHPGMRYAAAVRREVPVRTIMNLLGPLANPVDETGLVECRVLGVARRAIGENFAEALVGGGCKKAMVVCGWEDLDEVSCAGGTDVWWIHEEEQEVNGAVANGVLEGNGEDERKKGNVVVTKVEIHPSDFGLPTHPLDEVHGGKGPAENAEILLRILKNEMPSDHPVLHFVLINVATLLVVSGICEAETSSMGPGDDGKVIKERGPGGLRWKEGLRRARWCVESGEALKQWEGFVDVTNAVAEGR